MFNAKEMLRALMQTWKNTLVGEIETEWMKIHIKLTTGQYSDPWEYIDAVWQMIENPNLNDDYQYCSRVCAITIDGI